jgi:uncharacterized protein (TIGR00297 family)
MQILIGFLLAAVVSLLAWRIGALTRSGALAALITGTLIFGLGGLAWAVVLLTFFITSSGLSRLFRKRKLNLSEKFSKGSQRDWGQVLANGGFGALLAIGYALTSQPEWLWLAFAGSMAAVNADTWSTEVGVLSAVSPRLITNGQKVERGTSGGVTLLGLLASLGGALVIGIAALIAAPTRLWPLYLVIIVLGGLAGSVFDSLLGATLQAIYWCPTCTKETERHPVHTCGTPTRQIRGWAWFNNDVVNFCCSITGAIIAGGIWLLFFMTWVN